MDDIVRAIILGLVQGTTEFLPISSSGHLMLFPWVLGWDPHSLTFDVALHLGSLLAVLTYYHRDFLRLAHSFGQGLRERRFRGYPYRVMSLLIILGTIPAAAAGFVFETRVEAMNERPTLIATFLVVTGILLLLARLGRGRRTVERMGWRDAITVGIGQAFAIIPGISRAGATITFGVFRGLAPHESARFSFYLSVPIILGAGIGQSLQAADEVQAGLGPIALVAGMLTAAISAFIAIHILLKLMASRRISIFAFYCFTLAGFIFALAWLR